MAGFSVVILSYSVNCCFNHNNFIFIINYVFKMAGILKYFDDIELNLSSSCGHVLIVILISKKSCYKECQRLSVKIRPTSATMTKECLSFIHIAHYFELSIEWLTLTVLLHINSIYSHNDNNSLSVAVQNCG